MKKLFEQDNAWEFNDKELQRLGIDYQGKAVLAVRADLWFPYSGANVEVSVAYYTKGSNKPHFVKKISAGKPYPNKGILSAVQHIGRKKTKKFIPVVFDSLEKMRQTERIEILWTVRGNETDNFAEYILAEYLLNFAEPEQKSIYGLHSYDVIPNDIIEKALDKDSGLEEIIQKSFSQKDGKIVSSSGSTYDDVYFFTLNDDCFHTIAELHSGADTFKLKNIEESPLIQISFSELFHEVQNGKEGSSMAVISYYRTSAELNDKGIIY